MLAGLEHRLVASSATAKELQGQVARLQAELGGERERREGEGAAATQRVREREKRVAELEAEVEGERRHAVAAAQEGREGRDKVWGGREGGREGGKEMHRGAWAIHNMVWAPGPTQKTTDQQVYRNPVATTAQGFKP